MVKRKLASTHKDYKGMDDKKIKYMYGSQSEEQFQVVQTAIPSE